MAAGSIVIDLLMKTGQFETDTKRAEKRLREFEKAAAQVGKVLGTAIAVGATASVAALTMIINKQRDLIDSQAKLAQSLGTTYEGLAVSARAAELSGVSMSSLEQATKDLTRRLSQAAEGAGPAADALERLGLSVEELQALPLDKRIATINKAINDFIPAAEQAAVAGKLFGEEGSLAIRRMDPATIAEAARQVRVFGLNLSDVDAAKVEMANDAFSTLSLAVDGLQKQLTVALAPAIKAVGDEFRRAVEEAGGFGTVVPEAVDSTINALGFVINAANGVGRVFNLSLETGKLMAYGLSGLMLSLANTIINGPLAAVNLLIEQMNRVPGISVGPIKMSGIGAAIQRELAAAEKGFEATKARIDELLLEPLAGDKMVDAWRRALKTAQDAAEAAVAGRDRGAAVSTTLPTGPVKPGRDVVSEAERTYEAIQRQIRALETQAATFNMSEKQARLYTLAMDGATESQLAQAAALLDSLSALKQSADEQARLNALMAATPTANLEKQREDMQLLAKAFTDGRISATEYFEAVGARLGTLTDDLAKNTDSMSAFAEQAARNIQDAFADFLFDPFSDGVEGMLESFGKAIQRMIADAVAADLARRLFGDYGSTGSVGGWAGQALSFLGSVFGGGRAGGGDVMPGSAYLVGERGPEMFVPRTAGTVLSNAQTAGVRNEYNISVTVPQGSPQETRRAAASGAREALAFISNAGRYA